MKKLLFFLLQVSFIYSCYSQHFVSKRWDARFGGTINDEMYYICQTADGGIVAGGTSMSAISGNKTQSNWDNTLRTDDYWIVKIDANGNYIWDKRYGGTGEDILHCLIATKDGGLILAGSSSSDSSGDKTQQSQGGFDYWVVKLDSLGNKQWDRRFGGIEDDFLNRIKQTKDGGYILGGNSNSGISGDKTQDNRDASLFTADYWIVKIDSAGNKQWDKRFGSVEDDNCVDVLQTPDGGYLLGGICPDQSTSFDKTQTSFANGDNFWVIKTDSLGNKQWDKVYGGILGEIYSTSLNTLDGNFLLSGTSYDSVSGNKTAPSCGYWLVKIDTSGNKLGDWAYGNCGAMHSMSSTSDGGYLLTGISGTIFTIKIDSQMNVVWEKATLLANGFSAQSAGALESSSGCYVVGVSTTAGIGGDKTQPNWDTSNTTLDYWVVQYCDSFPAGIQGPDGNMHLQVYPNPTSGDVYINLTKDNLQEASFTLTNTTGQTIYQNTSDHLAHSYTRILDLSGLPTGIYILEVIVDGERIVKKVLKE